MEAPRVYQRDLDDLGAETDREGNIVHDESDEATEQEYVYRVPEGKLELIISTVLHG